MNKKDSMRIENQNLNKDVTWDIDDTDYFHFILDPHGSIKSQGEPGMEGPLLGSDTSYRHFAEVVDSITRQQIHNVEKYDEASESNEMFKSIGKESSIAVSCTCPGKEDHIFSSLLGITMLSSHLAVIEPERIIIRADHESMLDKVKLLSGGEAGFDPLFSEYVGFGMLTAAVYGDMNGTPTPNHILTALRELNNPNGVIMIVRNDLADRLNFGLAMERARADGIPVEMVTVTDDCWESQENPVGRRCLSGIIPVIKIAGAMSEKRKTMTDIYLMCRGLSITSISTVYPVESYAKIGSNLKGQGGKVLGKKEIPEVVREMVTCMIDEKKYFSTSIYPLNKFIVLINCYKFDKMLMGLLTNLLFHELGKAGVCIERLYSGTFISGPMSGYSFTLVKDIDEELLEYIDFRVPSRAWPLNPATVPKVRQKTFFRRPSYEPGPICGITLLNGPRNNPIFRRYCEECITAACRAIIAEEFHINRLDPEETYGSLVTVGARELLEQVSKGKLNYDWPYILMSQLSDILENCILGGIGTLYGLFFSGIALNLLSYASSVCLDFEQWVFAIKQGINAMASMAHFRVDDCTLLDALYPFYKALLPEDSNKFFLDRLRDAVTAASLGADRTALIKSKRHNLRSPEPGAKTVVTILQAIYDTTKRLYETDLDNEMDPNNIPCPIGIVELVEEPKYIVSEEIVAELCEDYEPETILYPEDELNEMMESTGITESDLPSMTEE